MKIGLAQYRFINNDNSFNLSQIERACKKASSKVDLLCFGEAFLPGFDSLSWDYAKDKKVAISQDSPEIEQLCKWSKEYNTAILVGYVERDDNSIYSSCAFINEGRMEHNYRRVSIGWKESSKTNYRCMAYRQPLRFGFVLPLVWRVALALF